MVYAESYGGGAIQCYVGQSSMLPVNGALGLSIVYPGTTQLIEPGACAVVPGSNGTITIDVPLSQVSLDAGVTPFSSRLYSVTSSTMTLPQPANTIFSGGGIGGVPFNLIDVVRGYDAVATSRAAGVGLASVRARLRHLGGSLEVDSAPDMGTRARPRRFVCAES